MEPITYANGSTLENPALSYGIVFSNFMSKGVYTFRCGTDALIGLMRQQLQQSGVNVRTRCLVEKIYTADRPPRRAPGRGRRDRRPAHRRRGGDFQRQPAGHDLEPGWAGAV